MKKNQKGVVFLLERFPNLGGIECITVNLANQLVDEGFRVHIYGKKGNIELESFQINPKVEVFIAEKELSAQHLCDYIKKNDLDVVINQGCWLRLTPIVEEVVRKTNAKVLSVLHNAPKNNRKITKLENYGSVVKQKIKLVLWPLYEVWSYKRYKRNLQKLYDVSVRMILLSERFINDFENLMAGQNVSKEKIIAIPNFIADLSVEKNVEKEKIIIYAGRVVELQKRFSRLIDIWQKVSKQNPDWKFIVVGNGIELEKYKEIVNQRGIERMEFCGYQKDVSKYLQKASILTLVSDYEGFGLVLVEAQQVGCVPIAYDSYLALHDIIDNGKDGIIVDAFDQEEYISKLNYLMNNQEQLKEMSFNSVKKAEKFSSTSIVKKWKVLIDNL